MQRKITLRFTVQVPVSNCFTSVTWPDLCIYPRLLKLITSINQSTGTCCCLEHKFQGLHHGISLSTFPHLQPLPLPPFSPLWFPSVLLRALSSPHVFPIIQAWLTTPGPAFSQCFCLCCFVPLCLSFSLNYNLECGNSCVHHSKPLLSVLPQVPAAQ